ncbi:MAG: hypothetical protein LIP09_15125 [Bacteroidales bacterium]|nr:hypothetical protein [Bacteroidales bacterium]
MILRFRIVSDEVSNFKREIEIDGTATFLDLKNAICESVNYDKNQMCSFFLCSDDWEKQKEITMEDMYTDDDQEVWLMDECELSDYLEEEGQKMLFVFDYMTDRCMFMELKAVITGKILKDPVCTLALGKAPQQTIDIDEFTKNLEEKAAASVNTDIDDIDEEFYGSDEYDPSEFDAEGFDEINYD